MPDVQTCEWQVSNKAMQVSFAVPLIYDFDIWVDNSAFLWQGMASHTTEKKFEFNLVLDPQDNCKWTKTS